jgi:hypothetical protein
VSPCSWGIELQEPGPLDWCSLESETLKCGHEYPGTRTGEWLRWQGPAAIVKARQILSSQSLLHIDYNRKFSAEKKVSQSLPSNVSICHTDSNKQFLVLALHLCDATLFSFCFFHLYVTLVPSYLISWVLISHLSFHNNSAPILSLEGEGRGGCHWGTA